MYRLDKRRKDMTVADSIFESLTHLHDALFKPRVCVIIPAYNESRTIRKVMGVVKKSKLIDEIVVVDDGSKDDTYKKAKKTGVTVIRHKKNKGKGAAMKTGLDNSVGDVVLFLDADLGGINEKKIDNLIEPVLNNKADFTKSTFVMKAPKNKDKFWDRKEGRVTQLTIRPLLNNLHPDIEIQQPLSGQYCSRRKFFENIDFEEGYGVDIGILLDAVCQKIRIKEVDIGRIENKDKHHISRIMAEHAAKTILCKYGIKIPRK